MLEFFNPMKLMNRFYLFYTMNPSNVNPPFCKSCINGISVLKNRNIEVSTRMNDLDHEHTFIMVQLRPGNFVHIVYNFYGNEHHLWGRYNEDKDAIVEMTREEYKALRMGEC